MRLVVSAAPPAAVLTMSRMLRRGQSASCARAVETARITATPAASRLCILVAIMAGLSAFGSQRVVPLVFEFSVRDCFYLPLSMPIRQKYQGASPVRLALAAVVTDLSSRKSDYFLAPPGCQRFGANPSLPRHLCGISFACPFGIPPRRGGRFPMLAFARAGFVAALVTLLSFPVRHRRRTKGLRATISPTRRSSWKPRSRPKSGQVTKPAADVAARGRRRVPAQRLPQRRCRCSARSSRSRPTDSANWLRLARDRAADPPGQRPRAHHAARARRDRRLHRLSAHQVPRRGGRQPAHHLPHLCRPPSVAAGARRLAARRSNCARSPTCAQQYETMREDHGFRLLD